MKENDEPIGNDNDLEKNQSKAMKDIFPELAIDRDYKPTVDDSITLEYHSELMENIFPESTIDKASGLKSIKYDSDLAILFFICKNHKLCSLIQTKSSISGWTYDEISLDNLEVSAFDIHHNESKNSIKIAYSGHNNNNSQLLISDSLDLNTINQSNLKERFKWKEVEINNTSRVIDHISMNQSGLLYSTSYRNNDATYSYFRYGYLPRDYTLPENTSKVIQLEVGQLDYDFGTFILYEMNNKNTMLFTSFPDEEFGESEVRRFNPEETSEINCFTTLKDKNGNDNLFIAGDGIFSYKADENGYPHKEVICNSKKGIYFSKIEVSSNDQELSIWSVGRKNDKPGLYYLTNRFYEDSESINIKKWTSPLQMHNEVIEFSSIKGTSFINQLFLFGSKDNPDELIHFWQDKVTTHWQEHPINVESLEEVKTIETFTVNISFSSESPVSFHDEPIKITSEATQIIYIDNEKVILKPNESYEARIDGNEINIIYPTKSVAVPLLFIDAEFLPEKKTIDLGHILNRKIKEVFTKKDSLKKAKLPDGSSLIHSSVSDTEIEQVVDATKKAYEHISGKSSIVRSKPLKTSINFSSKPIVNMSFTQQPATTLGNSLSSAFDWAGKAFGDIYHAVKKGFIEVTDFIIEEVENGVKFIVKIGNSIINWISKVASDIFHFLERVWEKIKIFFKNIFDFLGFLFNWKDIIHTKKIMKKYINNIFLGLREEISYIRKELYRLLGETSKNIETIKDQDFKSFNNINVNSITKDTNKEKKIDPRANFIQSKKSHITNSSGVLSELPETLMSEVSSFITPLLEKITELADKFILISSEIYEQLIYLIKGEIGIGDFLKYLVLSLLKLGVDLAREIINLILKITEKLIASVDTLLNEHINIPFFSALYKKISKDEMSIIDFFCLIISIPLTVTYKLGEGKAPFRDNDTTDQYIKSGKEIFKIAI